MKLSVVYKIVHGLADFTNVPISSRDNPFHLQSSTLSGFTTQTNSFKYSFFPRSVELWDSLPSDVALANYNPFKDSIVNIMCNIRWIHIMYKSRVWYCMYPELLKVDKKLEM